MKKLNINKGAFSEAKNSKAYELLEALTKKAISTMGVSANLLMRFPEHYWFFAKLRELKLFKFIEYMNDSTLAWSANKLQYALEHTGSKNGFICFLQGIFGEEAVIIIDDQLAGYVDIIIENYNPSFEFAIINQNSYTNINDDGYVEVIDSLETGDGEGDSETKNLFKIVNDFLPVHWKLRKFSLGSPVAKQLHYVDAPVQYIDDDTFYGIPTTKEGKRKEKKWQFQPRRKQKN